MFLLALLRAIFFLAFPYEQGDSLSGAVTYLYGLGFPLLNTSLVCLYFFVSEFVHHSAKARHTCARPCALHLIQPRPSSGAGAPAQP